MRAHMPIADELQRTSRGIIDAAPVSSTKGYRDALVYSKKSQQMQDTISTEMRYY